MFQRLRLCTFAATTLSLLCAAGGLQAAPAAPQAGPAPNPGLVSVEFRVLGDNGAPVLDLKPGEVSLKVGGKPREVRDLELIRLPATQPAADGKPVTSLWPPYASNSVTDSGRYIYVVIDDESIPSGREQTVRDAVGMVVENLSSRDRLGLVILSHGKFDVTLTPRHDLVTAALKEFVGRALRAETPEDAACRTLQAINIMQSVVSTVGGAVPASVVFVSGGLAQPNYAISVPRRTTSAAASDTGKTVCELKKELFDSLANDARKGAVDVWAALVPSDQSTTSINTDTLAGIENIAGLTGNPLIRLSGNPRSDFARLAKETSAYYIATFEADAAERSGTAARVELKVARDKTEVRARSEISIAKAGGGKGGSQNATDLLRVGTGYRDAPIRAVAAAARGASGGELNVMTIFEPIDPALAFSSAAIGLYDDKGKLVRQWSSKPTDLAAIPVMGAITAKPGVYRMRVAVIDVLGRSGTVDQEARIELEKGGGATEMSSLVLGAPFNGSFAPKLLYRTEPAALGYFEIYGTSKTAAVTAVLELAASPTGPAVASVPARVGQPTSDGRRIVLGELPLTSVRPGDYVVRVTVSVDGKPVGSVMKTLRKSVQ